MRLIGSPGNGVCSVGVVELYDIGAGRNLAAAAEEEEDDADEVIEPFPPIARRFLVSSSVGTPFFCSKPNGALTPGLWTRSKPGAGAKGG